MSVDHSEEISNRLITMSAPMLSRKRMKVLTANGETVTIPHGSFRFVPVSKPSVGTTVVRNHINNPISSRSLLLQQAKRVSSSSSAQSNIAVPGNVKLLPIPPGLMVVNLNNGITGISQPTVKGMTRAEQQKKMVVQVRSSLLQKNRKIKSGFNVLPDKNDLRVTKNLDEPKRYRGPRECDIDNSLIIEKEEKYNKLDDEPVHGVEDYLYGPSKKPKLMSFSLFEKDLKKLEKLPEIKPKPAKEGNRRKQIATPIEDVEDIKPNISEITPEEEVEEDNLVVGDEKEAVNLIEWVNLVGSVPGLKGVSFKINSNNLLEIIQNEDFEDCNSPKKTEVLKNCANCGTWGFEFYKERFCGKSCKDETDARQLLVIEKIRSQKEKKLSLKARLDTKKAQRKNLNFNNLYGARDVLDMEILRLKMQLEILKLEKIDPETPNKPMDMANYIKSVKNCKAPHSLFKEPYPSTKNPFKVGWKLEAIDPRHPNLVCVMTVVEVKGYRIKLRFDGYGANNDFWINANSPEIFEPGWCERTGHKLTPPRGWEGSFNWTVYLDELGGLGAPRNAFAHSQDKTQTPNVFRAGMKLEAVDKKNTKQICVATIRDVIDNRILVHIDGSEDKDDFWVENKSPYIHPYGWCAENAIPLVANGAEKHRVGILEGKPVFAPARGFKTRTTIDFKVNQKLEAVDKRNPELIRLATIIDVQLHQLRIKFDGWPLQYAYWIDDDSPDIHPMGWCRKTGYPLTDIPLAESLTRFTQCLVPGCTAEGHAFRVTNEHSTPEACPYSPQNYLKDNLVPDRFASNAEYLSVKQISHSKGTKPRLLPRTKSKLIDAKKPSSKTKQVATNNKKGKDKEKECNFEEEARLNKLSKDIKNKLDDLESDARLWTSDEVCLFVSRLLGNGKSEKFEEQLIDGEALLMLEKNDLTDYLELKFGPAITLYNAIQILRKMALEINKNKNST